MKNIIFLAIRHWYVVFLGFFFSLLIVLPIAGSLHNLGLENFQGIYPMFHDDEDYYFTKTKDIYDGHDNLGNPYLKEHKREPFMNSVLGEWVYAKTAKLFSVSIPALFFLSEFILPPLIIILNFISLFFITKSKPISFFFTFFYFLLFLGRFGRPINFQFSYLFFVVGFLCLWKIYDENFILKKNIFFSAILGITSAALLYNYPFFLSVLLAVYGLIMLDKLFKKSEREGALKSVFSFSVFAIPLALPYVINSINAMGSPYYQETLLRMGIVSSHVPGSLQNVALFILVRSYQKNSLNLITLLNFAFFLSRLELS
jgi:hypothetical protein